MASNEHRNTGIATSTSSLIPPPYAAFKKHLDERVLRLSRVLLSVPDEYLVDLRDLTDAFHTIRSTNSQNDNLRRAFVLAHNYGSVAELHGSSEMIRADDAPSVTEFAKFTEAIIETMARSDAAKQLLQNAFALAVEYTMGNRLLGLREKRKRERPQRSQVALDQSTEDETDSQGKRDTSNAVDIAPLLDAIQDLLMRHTCASIGIHNLSKRKSLESENGEHPGKNVKRRKAKDDLFIPCVGDWCCQLCGCWNPKMARSCHGRDIRNERRCRGNRENHVRMVQKDDGNAPTRKMGRYVGDWFCDECRRWWFCYNKYCGECGLEAKAVESYRMVDDGVLPLAPKQGKTSAEEKRAYFASLRMKKKKQYQGEYNFKDH